MSAVDDINQALTALADDTEQQATELAGARRNVTDKAAEMEAQLSSSSSGRDVADAFATAISTIEEAEAKLAQAAQQARDYAETLLNS
ncbi:hypothetical protein [Curtobacterium sp. MCPF17_046]|uniref:hypothetical protein n=1 Tax=Curtobacterium sp. MCPF17_046 TaxID=2175663 RepID=UPI000D9A6DBC|nr:hypothetical protein [Curtobacterium sp. MCPF17_046]PYY34490.1 hypothetical protein DEJ32_14885 [Curtobacterium sp. MCPF17_046]